MALIVSGFKHKEVIRMDLVFIAVTVVFFILCGTYVAFLGKEQK